MLWARSGQDYGDGYAVAVDQGNNVYFGYSYGSLGSGYSAKASVIKYDANGVTFWQTALNGADQTEIVTDNNNVPFVAVHIRDTAMLGATSYTPSAYEETALIKLDALTGGVAWVKNFQGAPGLGGSNFLTSIGYSSTAGVVVYAYGQISINATAYSGKQLYSFDPNGNINWTATGPAYAVSDMWIDQTDFYFSGHKTITSSNHDVYTAKMSQVATGISDTRGGRILSFYPNPTTGYLIVKPEVTGEETQIRIYNSCGQAVKDLVITKETGISLTLGPGIYFMECKSHGQSFTKKLIIE